MLVDDLALSAIARALDHEGDVDAACEATRRGDPLLRERARRRVRAAFADAQIATHVRDPRHALRLAYLAIARAPMGASVDDEGAVASAYDAAILGRSTRPRFWWATAITALAIACAVAIAGRAITRPRAPIAERAGPAPAGALATGGVPAKLPGDEVIHRVLSQDVPDYLIALDRLADRTRSGAGAGELATVEVAMKAALDRATGAEAAAALGEGPTKALASLLGAARAASLAPPGDAGERASEGLAEATSVLDDELAAAGAGYFVDGDVIADGTNGRRLAIVYAFAIERVRLFSAGDARVRALHLRRIDRLNWTHALLGFTRPHLRAALVLLDQLEEQVITLIAPGLAKGAAVRLFDPDASADDRGAVEARAAAIVREEYGAIAGVDAEAARLGAALGERRAILEAIEARASSRGYALVVPAKLRLPEGLARSIAPIATKDEIAALAKADLAIADDASARAFLALRDALAASIERHEVQHRLDARTPLAMPAALAARVGPIEQGGRERRHAAASRAELSAYLAELARDDRTPRVGLSMIARFLFDRRLHGSAESYAALAIFEGLAEAFGAADRALVAGRAIDRRAASRLYLELTAAPPAKLRDAAKRLWESLFDAKLADLRASSSP